VTNAGGDRTRGEDSVEPKIARDNGRVTRGLLRIYLGAAPGVGKTYAMLGEAHRRLERGTDIVVGFVETHDRRHTADMVTGLEVIPRREIEYRGALFEEMDLDAVLARHPQVALVDELAHTNVPGSRNAKRWEDINELLDAGIDVISTVNIQHLESLNDVVESITGIKQRETVPDAVVRAADQLELVDMSPEALRRRLAHGNVYKPEKVDAALGNYFRAGNLTALRELALLWLADRVEEGLERYRAEHDIQETWAARTRIVVALTGGPEGETLLRRGSLISGRSAGRALAAVHIIRGDGTVGARPDVVARLRQLTEDLGGTFHTVVGDDIASAVLEFTRSVNGTQVVVGASRRSRLSTALRPSTADAIVRDSGDIDVHVVSHERAGRTRPGDRRPHRVHVRRAWSWALAAVIPIGLTLALLPFRDALSLSTILLAFLLGVVATSLVGGLFPAIATSLVAGLLVNFYFVPPVGTFTIAEPENAFAIVAFVIVGSVVATIVDRSAALTQEAARRRAEATVLASLSAGVLGRGNGVRALLEQACETFGMRSAALFESSADGRSMSVVEVAGEFPPRSVDDADVSVDAGPGLVMALSGSPLPASDRRMLDAFATQAAAVLERNRLTARAADATRLRESDAIRTALIAAVSHDLRTPLAGIKASISTLQDESLTLASTDRTALLDNAAEAADRLDALLSNLLDLSRIQTGAVQPMLEPVSLDEVLQQALRGVPDTAVRDETDESLPLVLTDAGLLERAVANLVENAVRHSPHGTPVRLCATVIPEGILQLRIVDQGPGVDVIDRERMFRPFQRLGDAPDGAGIGLGLAVARGLSEAVGANLEAEDTPGGGLTMVMSVPLAPSTGVSTAPTEDHGDRP
jgi:two-component system, OmpR family, sensor histidine kinase KdpD